MTEPKDEDCRLRARWPVSEVKSAFYWRENMAPLEPNSCRRSKVSVKLLAGQVAKLREEGMTLTQIAARIGVTKRYVCLLLNKDDP